MNLEYVLGLDYGTDSVRAVLVDSKTGNCIASDVFWYPRWKSGLYCNPHHNQFRQHPLDHLEGLETTIKKVLETSGVDHKSIRGICVDTTGSSPLPVDKNGECLAMLPDFADNPNAMMVLWKDHTAIREAMEINQVSKTWGGEDFTKYEGGIYSSEWFWAKILHIIRVDQSIKDAAFSWMEHCDYITSKLIGCKDPLELKRSRCAAGHKAMWHESWGGLPSKEYLKIFDPYLSSLKERLFTATYTSDQIAGNLSKEWADKLGLTTDTVVAVGTFDAHAGAVGGAIEGNTLVKVMGTSTCDIIIADKSILGNKLINGICGQVDGSVISGKVGLEAGQSGFGDVLAWFSQLIAQPAIELIKENKHLDEKLKNQIIGDFEDKLIVHLSDQAEKIPVSESKVISLDWINGRRTPDANQALKGAIMNLNMGTDAPRIFKSLVEAISFGSKRIVERFKEEGVQIDTVIGLGGVAKKSPLVMQTLADVLNMPIKEAASEQAPALGASIYAAVAAGIYADTEEAIKAMGSGFDKVYHPISENAVHYGLLYEEYLKFGAFIENQNTFQEAELLNKSNA